MSYSRLPNEDPDDAEEPAVLPSESVSDHINKERDQSSKPLSVAVFLLGTGVLILFIISSVVEAPLQILPHRNTPLPKNGITDFDRQCQCRKIKVGFKEKSMCSEYSSLRGSDQKIISFTFYGNLSGSYYDGIIENVRLVKEFYPGYIMRLYHNLKQGQIDSICDIFCNSTNSHFDLCDAANIDGYGDMSTMFGMVWRYAPMADPLVSEFHARDLDSRISERELAAVREWNSSKALYHIMRDHYYHTKSIMGGMFGMKLRPENRDSMAGIFRSMLKEAKSWRYGLDQNLLEQLLFPIAKENAVVHDSYHCNGFEGSHAQPWPVRRIENVTRNFVGSRGSILERPCPEECRPKDHMDWTLC